MIDADTLVAEVPGLMRYARTIVRDQALAEDLVQETLVRALERGHSFRGDSSLATWLHRILHNAAVDHSRRHREEPTEDVTTLVEERWRDERYSVDASVVTARAETVEALKDSLLRLPLIYRTALVLHDMEGLTMPQIARIQQVQLPAAKQRLRRGRMLLVTALASQWERRVAIAGVPLTCWDARSRVSDYLDDTLAARERHLVETHLADCPTCPPLFDALVQTRRCVGLLRDPDSTIPADLVKRIVEASRAS
ncbi:sigma-70 family RNA polymerase sigma factor [Knoellia koreensis]|uniref:RNA polymerase sigma factor n=1 Tax=Knoellia koreensis TaxID=2730921 RepID=A0A849HKZ1_9MICO|nr:sigma-70 family RNA polymerase sigma factor [Knoellia sp. DB2414S]